MRFVRILTAGSLDPAFGGGDGIMKYRRLAVRLWDVAVQPDGDLAFGEMPSATPIGEDELERGLTIAARSGADEFVAPVARRGGAQRATG